MRLILALTATAALILGGCNSSDRSRDRDRDRSERSDRDRDRNSSADRGRDADRSRDEAPKNDDRASSGQITVAFMTGRWADSRDCTRDPVVFESDGEFEATGGGRGRWSVENGDLVMEANGRRQAIQVQKVSENEVRMVSNGASSYRCD